MNQNSTRAARFAGYTAKHGLGKHGAELEPVRGPRAVLGSQRVGFPTRPGIHSTVLFNACPLRAEDGSRSGHFLPTFWVGLALAAAAGLFGCSGKSPGGDKTTH